MPDTHKHTRKKIKWFASIWIMALRNIFFFSHLSVNHLSKRYTVPYPYSHRFDNSKNNSSRSQNENPFKVYLKLHASTDDDYSPHYFATSSISPIQRPHYQERTLTTTNKSHRLYAICVIKIYHVSRSHYLIVLKLEYLNNFPYRFSSAELSVNIQSRVTNRHAAVITNRSII